MTAAAADTEDDESDLTPACGLALGDAATAGLLEPLGVKLLLLEGVLKAIRKQSKIAKIQIV